MKVVSSEPLSYDRVKRILEEIPEEERSPEQTKTLEFLRTLNLVPDEEAQEFAKTIKEKVPVLKDTQIMMLVNLLPEDEEDLDVLFMKERINLTPEQKKIILEELDKIRPQREEQKG